MASAQSSGLVWGGEQSVFAVLDQLRGAPDVGGDDGRLHRHGLHHHAAPGLGPGGHECAVRGAEQARGVVRLPGERDRILEVVIPDRLVQLAQVHIVVVAGQRAAELHRAGDQQANVLSALAQDAGGLDGRVLALPGSDLTEHDQRCLAGGEAQLGPSLVAVDRVGVEAIEIDGVVYDLDRGAASRPVKAAGRELRVRQDSPRATREHGLDRACAAGIGQAIADVDQGARSPEGPGQRCDQPGAEGVGVDHVGAGLTRDPAQVERGAHDRDDRRGGVTGIQAQAALDRGDRVHLRAARSCRFRERPLRRRKGHPVLAGQPLDQIQQRHLGSAHGGGVIDQQHAQRPVLPSVFAPAHGGSRTVTEAGSAAEAEVRGVGDTPSSRRPRLAGDQPYPDLPERALEQVRPVGRTPEPGAQDREGRAVATPPCRQVLADEPLPGRQVADPPQAGGQHDPAGLDVREVPSAAPWSSSEPWRRAVAGAFARRGCSLDWWRAALIEHSSALRAARRDSASRRIRERAPGHRADASASEVRVGHAADDREPGKLDPPGQARNLRQQGGQGHRKPEQGRDRAAGRAAWGSR